MDIRSTIRLVSARLDVIRLASGSEAMAIAAYWMIAAGLVDGAIAAPFGFIDWLSIPAGMRAKRIGAIHGGGNVLVLLLFGASFVLRDGSYSPDLGEMVWSFAGAAVSLVTTWLGGELVARRGVGVDEDAGLNASNSLRKGRLARGK